MRAMDVERHAPAASEPKGPDRRVYPRIPAEDLRHVTARLATGGEVTLKDLSRTGARLESTRRMLPNSSVTLTLATPNASFAVTGLIVRSRIVRLASGLGYDVAVSFSQPIENLEGMGLPAEDPEPERPGEPALPVAPDAGDIQTLPADSVPAATPFSFDSNGW
jgi:hypothetical protein